MRNEKYLALIKPFETRATKRVLQVNPTIAPLRVEPEKTVIFVYEYDANDVNYQQLENVEDCYKYLNSSKNTWINFDGLKKADIDKVCAHFGIHPLIAEDIFSSGQRPKMDELNHLLYCLLNMLFFNQEISSVEN
jgi:magnesium transporter